MHLEHCLSALLQLHHSRLNTWLQWIGQRQLQDETRNIEVLGFGAPYIRGFVVIKKLFFFNHQATLTLTMADHSAAVTLHCTILVILDTSFEFVNQRTILVAENKEMVTITYMAYLWWVIWISYSMSPWMPLLQLLSWCPIFKSSHCTSLDTCKFHLRVTGAWSSIDLATCQGTRIPPTMATRWNGSRTVQKGVSKLNWPDQVCLSTHKCQIRRSTLYTILNAWIDMIFLKNMISFQLEDKKYQRN